ncbi:MAG: DUF11 domain-containing protein [Verrucomicrobia bacterium]|nr:DUF11 domain-containing protein [Verrucomicrobiota bacterium]
MPPGLLSWWRGESNTVEEITGVAGVGASGVTYERGRVGAGFVLDGNQGTGIQVGSPAALRRGEFSIEGWLQRADRTAASRTSVGGTILGADTGGWNFALLHNGALTFGKSDSGSVTSLPAITDRAWHHVAVTRDATEVRFYTDGVLVSTHPYSETFVLDQTYGLGGIFPSGRNGFWGSLDEVAFYERILTGAEIAAIASAGGAPKCVEDLVLTVTPGGPIPVGEDWDVTLTVAALGRAESTQVILTASIPPGLQYQSATASQGTVENLAGVLRATLGTIPAAGSANVRLVLRPLLAGNYVVSGAVQRLETELSSVNNRVEITGSAVPLMVSVAAPAPVTEPEPVEFVVSLSAPSRGTVRVAYQTDGLTATAGADYETQAGVLEFLPGTVRQVVRVPVAADGIYETDETLRLTLGTPEGAGAGTLTALAVIRSPEPLPVARVAPLILTEGNSGTTPMRFEVQLDRPSGLPARLRFATTNDSAKAPTDYVAAEGLLELAPGQTNAVIEVLVHGDTSEEPNETVVVTFSDLEGLRMPTASVVSPPVPGIGTIVNDDAVPGLARSFTWDAVPAEATTGVPFAARLTARDGIGDVASAFNGAVAVRGYAGPGAPSSVVLTEIVVGTLRGVELQNVSPDPVDISGWQIHLYDVTRWPAPQIVFVIPSTTVLAPAAVVSLEVVRNQFQLPGTFPRFRVLGDLVWPRPNPQQVELDPPIGVVVADASGAVADTFFTGGADPQQIGVPKVLTDEDWSGPAVDPWTTGVIAPTTFIRPSGQSRNTRSRSDWVAAASLFNGFGSPNPGLVLPFEDAVPLPVAPDAVTGFASGVWTGDLTLNGYAPVVRLLADDGNGRRGLSAPMRPTVVDDLQVQFTVTPELLAAPRVEGAFEVTVTNAGPVLSSNVTATVLLSPRYGGGLNVVLGAPQLSQGTARVRTLLRPQAEPQVEIVGEFGEMPAGGVATMRFRASRSSGFGAPVTKPEGVVSTVSVARQPLELNQINNRASVTQELAQPCSDLGEGTVAWWRGAGDFLDALGAHPGTAVGSAALGEGRVGSTGFHLGGGDGVVRVPDAEALDFKAGESFSMELWFRTTPEAGRSIGLFGKGLETAGSRGYGIGVEEGRVVVRLADGERSDAISGFLPILPDVRDGQWHHLVVSADRGGNALLSVWLDGVATSNPSPLSAVGDLSNEAPLELGGRGGAVASWVGDLDEVILRRTAVTAAEAQAGYRSGGHGRCTTVLEVQPVTPRFFQEAGQWIALDRGVVGQPYRFGFELRNRGPLAEGARMLVGPVAGETNFVLHLPTGPVLPDPVEGAAIADLGSVPVNAVIPMSVDWTGTGTRTRWELLALGLEPGARSGFAPVVIELVADTDRDGMADEYEQANGLDLNSPDDAISDTDLDGYTAAQEFEAGTKANDGASRLALFVEGSTASVHALASRVYRLERSSPLQTGGWDVIQTFRPEVDGPVSMELPASDSPETYYRVVALLPY